MKVIGLTDELKGDAEQQCAAGFRAWLAEAETGTWSAWDELKKHYPEASQTSEEEAHFPLTADGTGVRAMVFFKLPLMLLLCIAPAPVIFRTSHRRRISLPQSN
jgi:mRNA-degrading endonuclease HigB of HigAB toxin-antitoxin module